MSEGRRLSRRSLFGFLKQAEPPPRPSPEPSPFSLAAFYQARPVEPSTEPFPEVVLREGLPHLEDQDA